MKNHKQLLTIAIPTYNRSNYLQKCLEHIIPQLCEEVKLVVRDNKSTNYNFFEFIKPYVDHHGVEAIQNSVNVGSDGNAAKLFENCQTPWLWILGDDDYLLPGAVGIVLEYIKNHSDSIFIKFDSYMEKRTVGLHEFADYFNKKGEFGQSFFISIGIHNIEKTKEMMYWHYRYMSTQIAQILRVLKYVELNDKASCVFSIKPLLTEHGTDITWNKVELIPTQLLIFDFFKKSKNLLNSNIFREIERYSFIFTAESDLSQHSKVKFYISFIIKYGLINTLLYNHNLMYELFKIRIKVILKKLGIRR